MLGALSTATGMYYMPISRYVRILAVAGVTDRGPRRVGRNGDHYWKTGADKAVGLGTQRTWSKRLWRGSLDHAAEYMSWALDRPAWRVQRTPRSVDPPKEEANIVESPTSCLFIYAGLILCIGLMRGHESWQRRSDEICSGRVTFY